MSNIRTATSRVGTKVVSEAAIYRPATNEVGLLRNRHDQAVQALGEVCTQVSRADVTTPPAGVLLHNKFIWPPQPGVKLGSGTNAIANYNESLVQATVSVGFTTAEADQVSVTAIVVNGQNLPDNVSSVISHMLRQ